MAGSRTRKISGLALAAGLVVGAVGAAFATTAESDPDGSQSITLTVSPSDGLAGSQSVSVSGAGFAASNNGNIRECTTGDAQICSASLSAFTADANGAFSGISVTATRTYTSGGTTVDCAVTTCRMAANAGAGYASHHLTFGGGAVTHAKVTDFNGDGSSDISVFRPASGTWYVNGGSGTQWGANGDVPVPGDYDGDGKTDQAIFRPSTGLWAIHRSGGGDVMVTYGVGSDKPVPADYDGDGKTDIAVFRPSTGTWFIRRSSDNTDVAVTYGMSSDIPVPGDYDGDGKADVAMFRPASGTWFVHQSSGGDTATNYGANGDIPVPGDYDGDAKTDIAIFRPSTGLWSIHRSSGGDTAVTYGVGTDIPVPADYDGDGKTDIAVFRPSIGAWYVRRSSTSTDVVTTFGISSDVTLQLPPAIRTVFY